MDDETRRSFANLILLCHPHHKLVDRLEPERFPAKVLLDWKEAREAQGFGRDVASQLSESQLSDMIEDFVRRSEVPTRLVRVEVWGGTILDDKHTLTRQLDTWRPWVETDGLDCEHHFLVVYVRNVGQLNVTANSVRLHSRTEMGGESADAFYYCPPEGARANPELPTVIAGGSSKKWFIPMGAVNEVFEVTRRLEELTEGEARPVASCQDAREF